jgi:peptidoglycan hydrolase-like protein with peptidoglycan-binding domain
MTLWKISTTAALVSLVFAGSAFAQATTGTEMKAEGKKMRKSMASGDEKVKAAQQALKDKGYDAGTVDGRMGPKTQAALRDFQKAQGMESTGDLDPKTTQALGMDVGTTGSADASSTAGSASPSTESPITVSASATGDK